MINCHAGKQTNKMHKISDTEIIGIMAFNVKSYLCTSTAELTWSHYKLKSTTVYITCNVLTINSMDVSTNENIYSSSSIIHNGYNRDFRTKSTTTI